MRNVKQWVDMDSGRPVDADLFEAMVAQAKAEDEEMEAEAALEADALHYEWLELTL